MNLKIVVAAHKPYPIPEDKACLPLQVGAALNPPIDGFVRDDAGENISARNPNYCELTGLYWAWKNLDADAVGLVHYRRRFKATSAEIAAALRAHEAVLPKKRRYFVETNYSQYVHAHHAIDLETTRQILAERHPDYLAAYDASMKRTSGHRFNMLVMRRETLDRYCSWLFDVLFELERRLDISLYSRNDARVFGFVAERLLDVWIEKNGISSAEFPVRNLESQHWPTKIARFLMRKFLKRRRFRLEDSVVRFTMGPDEDLTLSDSMVSVIIPTYQAGSDFPELIRRLKAQEKVSNVEIVVVDSGSTDGTVETARAAGAVLVEIPHESFSHASARNLGVRHAHGAHLVVMTQDALPPDDLWLVRFLQPLLRKQASAVVCRQEARPGEKAYGRYRVWKFNRMCLGREDRLVAWQNGLSAKSLRWRAQLYDAACAVDRQTAIEFPYRGGFAEDLDLGLRLLKSGRRIAKLASVSVVHSHDRSAFYCFRRNIAFALCPIWEQIFGASAADPGIAATTARILTGAVVLTRFRGELTAAASELSWTDFIARTAEILPAIGENLRREMSQREGGDPMLGATGDRELDDMLASLRESVAGRWTYDDECVWSLVKFMKGMVARFAEETGCRDERLTSGECCSFLLCAFAGWTGRTLASCVRARPEGSSPLDRAVRAYAKGV